MKNTTKVLRRAPEDWTVETLAKALGEPVRTWEGRCYAIAVQCVKLGLIEGTAVYGHWLGDVDETSIFYGRWSAAGFCRHGWVVTPSGVFDPTQWTFLSPDEPYLYCGPAGENYDEGGERMRRSEVKKAPAFTGENPLSLSLPCATTEFLREIVSPGGSAKEKFSLSREQVFWLANLPLTVLGTHAKPVYKALKEAGRTAFIPIDNYRRVTEGRWP